jgi:hypothetical protein
MVPGTSCRSSVSRADRVGEKWTPRRCALSVGSNLERGNVSAMLSWQVGRVKITRIVEMDLPVEARVILQAT